LFLFLTERKKNHPGIFVFVKGFLSWCVYVCWGGKVAFIPEENFYFLSSSTLRFRRSSLKVVIKCCSAAHPMDLLLKGQKNIFFLKKSLETKK
jgi:hypothetical protein